MKENTKVSLGKSDAGKLQDAWHYAMLILNRKESTFDGSREFPDGILGQIKAYESLLSLIDKMTRDNETWQLVGTKWYNPENFEGIIQNASEILGAITSAAFSMGINARTGEKLAPNHCKDDSCDQPHCARCGVHIVAKGYCDECSLFFELQRGGTVNPSGRAGNSQWGWHAQ